MAADGFGVMKNVNGKGVLFKHIPSRIDDELLHKMDINDTEYSERFYKRPNVKVCAATVFKTIIRECPFVDELEGFEDLLE